LSLASAHLDPTGAAINTHFGACGEAAVVARKEEGGSCDLLGLAEAAARYKLGQRGTWFFRGLRQTRRDDRAETDDVHTDAFRAELIGPCAGKQAHGRLAGAIGAVTLTAITSAMEPISTIEPQPA
jgi:hypothetical protein